MTAPRRTAADTARDARARALSYALTQFLNKQAAERLPSPDGPDAKERSLDDSRADKASIPERL
jgi:hypothetical protein